MKYIAYGSNMVKEQMAYRCPGAKLIGTGYLPNHRLAFYLHATVERSHARNARVPVAVWEIDEADEQRLDRYCLLYTSRCVEETGNRQRTRRPRPHRGGRVFFVG